MVRNSRCSLVSSVASASSVMPRMPFMGVRISWLMLGLVEIRSWHGWRLLRLLWQLAEPTRFCADGSG